MPAVKLKIDELALDPLNPRITGAKAQIDAMQKIIDNQKNKLVKLADHIATNGLNPMDRLVVLRVRRSPRQFVAIEGNRRVCALKILSNPAVLGELSVPPAMRRAFEKAAGRFDRDKIEPIECVEVESRSEAGIWLELRHGGENEGAGVVPWSSTAGDRFRGGSPTNEALSLALEHGGFSTDEKFQIEEKLPFSTLERLIDDKTVRALLGLDVKGRKLVVKGTREDVVRSLSHIVRELMSGALKVGQLMKTEQMVEYVKTNGLIVEPDLQAKIHPTPPSHDLALSPTPSGPKATRNDVPKSAATPSGGGRKDDPSDRKAVVPKGCKIQVTDNRIASIYKELRTLPLEEAKNAIAVLLRVFIELSVDHFLESNGGSLKFAVPGKGDKWKDFEKKFKEVVQILKSRGVPEAHFQSLERSISKKDSPLSVDLLHAYVHNRFATPTVSDLSAAWDHAHPLFEKIWP